MSSSQWRDEQWPAELTRHLLTMRIIICGLTAGCVFFLILTQFIGAGGANAADPPVLSYTAFAFAIGAVFARFVVPGMVVAAGRKQIVREAASQSEDFQLPTRVADLFNYPEFGNKLCGLLQTATIISGALLEGAAFFALIAHMLEGTLLSIIVALVLVVGLMMHFPTRSRVVDWLERQLQHMQAMSSFAP